MVRPNGGGHKKAPAGGAFKTDPCRSWRLLETIFLAEQAGFEPAEGY